MKLVLFDVDGTLVDSQNLIVAAMAAAHAEAGLPAPPRAAVLAIVGLSLPQAFAVLGQGAPDYPAPALAEGYKRAFFRLSADPAHAVPLFPGARAAIEALAGRPGVALGLATGKSRRGVARMLDLHGLDGMFATVQTADDHPSKPAPDMVLAAMAETGAAPADTVLLGDTTFDMVMTRAAGALPIGVAWGYHPAGDLVAAGAHAVLDSFDAFVPAWERLAAGGPAAP